MRTVSPCARASRQSRLRAAAAAAEFFSSVLREVFMASSPDEPLERSLCFFGIGKYLDNAPECQRATHAGFVVERRSQGIGRSPRAVRVGSRPPHEGRFGGCVHRARCAPAIGWTVEDRFAAQAHQKW